MATHHQSIIFAAPLRRYDTYEEAVYRCLLDRVTQVCLAGGFVLRSSCWCAGLAWQLARCQLGQHDTLDAPCPACTGHIRATASSSPWPAARQEEADSRVTVLMVVGAGRGPLVAASLRASVRAKRRLRWVGCGRGAGGACAWKNRASCRAGNG